MKTKSNSNRFHNEWILDFETTTKNTNYYRSMLEQTGKEHSRPVYWYMKHYKEDKQIGGNEAEGCSHQDFADLLTKDKRFWKNTTIWLHNLSFDGIVITYILENVLNLKATSLTQKNGVLTIEGYETKINKDGFRETYLKSGYFDVFQSGNKIYCIRVRWTPYNSKIKEPINIIFRCSYLMLSSSVGSLGKSYKNIEFLGRKLEKMNEEEKAQGETFYDVEPMELNELKQKHPDYIDYCKRDVEIVRRSLIDFEAMINELEVVKKYNRANKQKSYNPFYKPITIASLGRTMLEKIYVPFFKKDEKYRDQEMVKMEHCYRSYFTEDINDIKNGAKSKFYSGGFTQFSPLIEEFENVLDCGDAIKLDFSSAYPYQMTFSLPYGQVYDIDGFNEIKQKHWKENEDYVVWLELFVKKATPKQDAKYVPILLNYVGEKGSNGNIKRYSNSEQKNFWMRVSKLEYEELQHWYDFKLDETLSTSYFQQAAPFMRQIANELYDKKDYYSSKGDDAKKLGVKILINSIYGSLAISNEFDTFLRVHKDDEPTLKMFNKENKNFIDFDADHKKETLIKLLGLTTTITSQKYQGVRCMFDSEPENCKWSSNSSLFGYNVSASAFITSRERVYLWSHIRKFGAQHFMYSDTDSIIFYNLTPQKRKEIEEYCANHKPNVVNNLGRLEIEHRYIIGFNSNKAKQYLTMYLSYDEKTKQFYNDSGYCEQENAKVNVSVKSGGFDNTNEQLKKVLSFTKKEYEAMTKEQLLELFGEFGTWTNEELEEMKNGNFIIVDGGKYKINVIGAPLIMKKNKLTKKGDI